MRKIAQIEFFKSEDDLADSIVRLYDEQGNLIHGKDFPKGFTKLIDRSLLDLRNIIGPL